MKYDDLVMKASSFPWFGGDLLNTIHGTRGNPSLQLSRWVAKGRVLRLKRGMYTLPEERRKAPLSLRWLANTLYSPSYLSLEYMLGWYDMIPERVMTVTSVSSLKTFTLNNPLGQFVYRHLKKELFFGFVEIKDEFNYPILVSTPEKALLDWIYLDSCWEPTLKYVEENMRWQQMGQLKKKRLRDYARQFDSLKIMRAVDFLSGIL